LSTVSPHVAVKNLLYTNWSIGSPAKDSATEATGDPERVWFGNRMLAYGHPRIHSYQISVRGGQASYRPWQLGGTAKYEVQEPLTIHVWVLPGVSLDIEAAHTKMKAMYDEIKRILESLGDSAGSGIQQLVLNNKRDVSRLDRSPPQLYYQIDVTAILYEGIS